MQASRLDIRGSSHEGSRVCISCICTADSQQLAAQPVAAVMLSLVLRSSCRGGQAVLGWHVAVASPVQSPLHCSGSMQMDGSMSAVARCMLHRVFEVVAGREAACDHQCSAAKLRDESSYMCSSCAA